MPGRCWRWIPPRPRLPWRAKRWLAGFPCASWSARAADVAPPGRQRKRRPRTGSGERATLNNGLTAHLGLLVKIHAGTNDRARLKSLCIVGRVPALVRSVGSPTNKGIVNMKLFANEFLNLFFRGQTPGAFRLPARIPAGSRGPLAAGGLLLAAAGGRWPKKRSSPPRQPPAPVDRRRRS